MVVLYQGMIHSFPGNDFHEYVPLYLNRWSCSACPYCSIKLKKLNLMSMVLINILIVKL